VGEASCLTADALSAPPGQEGQPTTSKDFAKHPKSRLGRHWRLRSICSGRSPPLLAWPVAQRESPRTLSACVCV